MSTLLTDSIQPCSVVDIGSNSMRLVIFDTSAGYPHPVYNERIFCALGEGVGKCGHLTCDNAIDDALTAVVRFARVSAAGSTLAPCTFSPRQRCATPRTAAY